MTRIGQLAFPAILLGFTVAGCHSNPTQNQSQSARPAQDPAAANLASASNVIENPPAPQADQPSGQTSGPGQDSGYYSEANDEDPANDVATDPPPDLPGYDQPPAPGENYIWSPGYWAWSSQGYYWVPGAWVLAPYVGALWTPGYWNYESGRYHWHHGYWGRHVGYYGGVNYGHGYNGNGYEGGYWRGNDFYYNREVSQVVARIHNVYDYRVENRTNTSRVSYDGGRGGLNFRPSAQQQAAEHEQHIAALPVQQELQQSSRGNRAQFASDNHGHPQLLAENRPVNGGRGMSAPSRETFIPNRPAPSPSGRTAPGHVGPTPMERPGQAGTEAPASRQPTSTAPPRNRPETRTPPPPQANGHQQSRPAEMRPNHPQIHHEPVNAASPEPLPRPEPHPAPPRSNPQRENQKPQDRTPR